MYIIKISFVMVNRLVNTIRKRMPKSPFFTVFFMILQEGFESRLALYKRKRSSVRMVFFVYLSIESRRDDLSRERSERDVSLYPVSRSISYLYLTEKFSLGHFNANLIFYTKGRNMLYLKQK